MSDERKSTLEATAKLVRKSKNDKMFELDIPSKGKDNTWFHLSPKVQSFGKSFIEGDSVEIKYMEGSDNGAGTIVFLIGASNKSESPDNSNADADKKAALPGKYISGGEVQKSIENQKIADVAGNMVSNMGGYDVNTLEEIFNQVFDIVAKRVRGKLNV